MKRKFNRRADVGVVLIFCLSMCIGLLSGYVVFRVKNAEHLSTTISEAENMLELTNSFVSTYSEFTPQDEQGDTMVPAAFRAAASRHFNDSEKRVGRPVAVMVGLRGREIETPPTDDALATYLASMVASGVNKRKSIEFGKGGDRTIRTIFPSIASQESCAACHNRLQPDGPVWTKGDLMGAYVVDSSIAEARSYNFRFSVLVGMLTGVVALLGGWLYRYSKRLQAQALRLRRLADTDPLTGCMNRRALINAFNSDDIQQQKGALFVLDLDHFKQINDKYGHQAGDLVLIQFSELVRNQLREADLLARIGGEEFVVFLPDTDRADAYTIAQRTCVAVSHSEVVYKHATIRYTVSMGAVVIPQLSSSTLDTWLSVADRFLYRAKELGRNQIFPAYWAR